MFIRHDKYFSFCEDDVPIQCFSFSVQLMAMRDVSATEAALINALEPLWGAAFAWFALGERWGLRGWVGAAFILGSSLVTQIWGRPEEQPKSVQLPKDQEVVKLKGDRVDVKQRSASRRN